MSRLLDTFQPKSAAAWILASILVWWLIGCLAFSHPDGYGDMIESDAWGQSLAWGSLKPPPLLAWIVGLRFQILPESNVAYHLPCWLNAGAARHTRADDLLAGRAAGHRRVPGRERRQAKGMHYLPRQELAQAVQARWTHLQPDAKLEGAAGEWPEVAALAFYAGQHPRALPNLPDTFPASVVPLDDWALRDGVLLCQRGQSSACTGQTESWLTDHGLPIRKEVVTVQRSGWRFPKPRPRSYTVYWYGSEIH